MKLSRFYDLVNTEFVKLKYTDIRDDEELWDDIHFVMDFSGVKFPFNDSFTEYDQKWFDINQSDFIIFIQKLYKSAFKFTFLKKYSLREMEVFLNYINEEVGEMQYCVQSVGNVVGEKIFYLKDDYVNEILATFILTEIDEFNQQHMQCIYLEERINIENKSVGLYLG